MSKDIRVALSFFNHHKTKRLHREFGDSGIVSLWKLWSYCAVHQQDGDLSAWDDILFQTACERDTDCMQFVERLASERIHFLDRDKEGNYSIHDWREHQPWVFFAKVRSEIARDNVKKRWENKEKNTSGIPSVKKSNTIGNTPSPSPSPSPKEKHMSLFDEFWENIYPHRDGVKHGRQETLIEFMKLTDEELPKFMIAAKNFSELKKRDKIGTPDPVRFLIKGRGKEKVRPWLEYVTVSAPKRWDS